MLMSLISHILRCRVISVHVVHIADIMLSVQCLVCIPSAVLWDLEGAVPQARFRARAGTMGNVLECNRCLRCSRVRGRVVC